MAKKISLREKSILLLTEFARDHEGWPTLATLRDHFNCWLNKEPGYEGDHFFKFGYNNMVNREKYYKWVESCTVLRPPTGRGKNKEKK